MTTAARNRDGSMTGSSDGKALIDQLYRDHHRSVLAYCLRRTDRETAYDVTAEVFVVAVRRVEEVPIGEGALPWLYGTAFKVLSNQRRSTKRFRALARRSAGVASRSFPGADIQVVRTSEYEEVAVALEHLPARDREVLRLATWEELPRQEIAELLGISRSGVDKRISRALERIRRRLNISPASATVTKPQADPQEGGSG